MKNSRKLNLSLISGDDTQSFHGFLALAVTIPLLVLIGCTLSFIPDVLDMAFIKNTYNLPLSYFLPEKSETCQYVILSILFPILFCIVFKIFSIKRFNTKRTMSEWNSVMRPAAFGLACAVSIWSVIGNYYGVRGFSKTQNISLTILIAAVLVIWTTLTTGLSIYHENQTKWNRVIRVLALLIGIAAALFAIGLFVTDNYFKNGYTLHHFDAYYYPVFEVFNGRTLIVDFNALYGFYPYIMVPFFKLTGGISMARFSIFMTILVLVNISSIGLTLWLNVKNKIIALIGFIAILCTMFFASFILNNGYYLQYTPHRTLFPCLLILLCTLLVKADSRTHRKVLIAAGYVLCAVSLFWNIDSGVVVVAGWCLFRMVQTAVEYPLKEKKLCIRWMGIIGFTILSVGSMICAVLVLTYIRTGQLVALKSMIAPQILFKGTGFYMLPMTVRSPWVVLAVVYMAGLAKSLKSLAFLRRGYKEDKVLKDRNALYFLITILGVGLFSYYQGRSHRDVLVDVLWPGVLLLVLFAQEYAVKATRQFEVYRITHKVKKSPLLTDLAILFVTIGILITIPVSFTFRDLEDGTSILSFKGMVFQNSQKVLMESRLNYIRINTEGSEDVDILTLYFTEYYSMMNKKNPMPIRSAVDWVTKEDYRKVIEYLETTNNKVFMDKKIYTMLMTYMTEPFKDVMDRRFRKVNEFSGIKLYVLKKA